ncbi:MAG: hypothetical protein ACLP1X_15975 [Polyangiaceae bacterium]
MRNRTWRAALTRRARAVSIAVAVPALAVLMASAATAQPHKPAAARAGASKKATAGDAGAAPSHTSTSLMPAVPQALATTGGPSDAGVVESKTLDGGTHVFKFSELDIEGRLKSPQLVYFLRRVRAEFAAEELGHRTFMREMSETRKESSF